MRLIKQGLAWLVRRSTRSLIVDGRTRSYFVHAPPGYDPAKPAPVVLALHGATRTGPLMAWFTGLNAKADAAGFLAVYPDGRGSRSSVYWNGGNCRGSAVGGRVMRRQRVECASHPLDAGIRLVSNGTAEGIESSMMPMVPRRRANP